MSIDSRLSHCTTRQMCKQAHCRRPTALMASVSSTSETLAGWQCEGTMPVASLAHQQQQQQCAVTASVWQKNICERQQDGVNVTHVVCAGSLQPAMPMLVSAAPMCAMLSMTRLHMYQARQPIPFSFITSSQQHLTHLLLCVQAM